MQLINAPGKLVLPFAASGAKNTIPVASQIGIVAGAASLTDGFPPLTRTPLAAGGVPPSGLDMNGIIYELSAILRWANAGGGYVYDGTFAADSNVGGYPKGARVLRSDGLGYWFNTADNNTTDPEGAGAVAAGWVPDFTTGISAVTMTNANVTLTPLQYGKPIIVISGLLTANLNLIFPSVAGEWTVINNTTGAFAVTCKTAAGTGIIVNSTQVIVGNGTNVYSAVNDAISLLGELVAVAGGTADAITATLSPPPRVLATGVPFMVRAATANLTAAPTFTPNSGTLTAKTIVKGAGSALVAGDIAGAGHWLELQYDLTLDKWVLLNPAHGVITQSGLNSNGTASYATSATLISADFGRACFYGSASAGTLTLPSLASSPDGSIISVYNLQDGLCTLAASGANPIFAFGKQSLASVTLNKGESIQLVSTGSAWVQVVGNQGAIGVDQTWQNVLGSRANNTTYTNTTGRPIMVSVTNTGTNAGTTSIYGYVNGLKVTVNGSTYTSGGTASFAIATFIVPPGGTYSVAAGGISSFAITNWAELR